MTASESVKQRERTAFVALSPTAASNPEVTSPKICAFALSKRPHIKARHKSDLHCQLLLLPLLTVKMIATLICPFAKHKRAYSIH